MIILEGPDNSGKTTLAQMICAQTGYEYRRAPSLSSTEGVDDAVFQWWDQQLSLPTEDTLTVVYDRCTYISDPIYRLVSSKPPLRTEQQMMNGIQQMLNQEVHLIFCLPPWSWSARHCEEEHKAGLGLSYANIDQLRVIHWAYHCTYMLYSEAQYERVTSYDPSTQTFANLYEHFFKSVQNHHAKMKGAFRGANR